MGAGDDRAGHRLRPGRHAHHREAATATNYVLNGAKTFITGGVHADRVIVAARTSPPKEDDRRFGISLFAVNTHSPGYTVGRKLDKLGLRTSDTAELAFEDVRVPAEDLLGEENQGFSYLGRNLASERWGIAHGAYAQAKAAVSASPRRTSSSGRSSARPVASFQNTKFELAACKAEVDAAEAVTDRALEALDAGELTPAEAASAKLFCTEVAHRVIDRCLQLHGGYGFINEYPIARLYADNRVNRIYGGTSEIMKTIIAKDMGSVSSGPFDALYVLAIWIRHASSRWTWPPEQCSTFLERVGRAPDGIVVADRVYWTTMGRPTVLDEESPRRGAPRASPRLLGARNGGVHAVGLDGSGRADVVPEGGLTTGKQLALAAGWLYWGDREGFRVSRVRTDGTGLADLVVNDGVR